MKKKCISSKNKSQVNQESDQGCGKWEVKKTVKNQLMIMSGLSLSFSLLARASCIFYKKKKKWKKEKQNGRKITRVKHKCSERLILFLSPCLFLSLSFRVLDWVVEYLVQLKDGSNQSIELFRLTHAGVNRVFAYTHTQSKLMLKTGLLLQLITSFSLHPQPSFFLLSSTYYYYCFSLLPCHWCWKKI